MTDEQARWKRLPKSIREDMDLEGPRKDHGGHPEDGSNEGAEDESNNNDDDDRSSSRGPSGSTAGEAESPEKALADIEPHKRPGRAAARQEDLVTRGLRKLEEEARLEARHKAMRKHNR